MADTKGKVKRASKKFMLFSVALRQNALKSDVARFSAHESKLSYNESGCSRLRKVVKESRGQFYLLQQILYMLLVLPAQSKLVLQ